jgi:prepilin-type processing-associated H-X9-DG protein
MKPRRSNQRNQAVTITEVLLVIAVLLFLVILFLPGYLAHPRRPLRLECINNLYQIGIAYRVWADDHEGKFPFQVPDANGGTLELAKSGNVWVNFWVMSNELATPKILTCLADTDRLPPTTNFSSQLESHISYFIGLDANTNFSETLLSGDDDLLIGGDRAKSGRVELLTNTPISWTTARHKFGGNVGFADGSVESINATNLQRVFQQTGLATNRLAIP